MYDCLGININMIDWIQKNLQILTNKNKNVIIYPDTLEKRNRRLEDTTTDPILEKLHAEAGRDRLLFGSDQKSPE
jgi:predicted TIM-barrel fold metal-dependent hydrolase